MVEKKMVVDERVPLPARRLQNLVQQLLKIAKQQAVRVVQDGGARVNGRMERRPHALLDVGALLEVEYDAADYLPPPPLLEDSQAFAILYEDAHLVVVEKPPGLLTVPTPYKERNTLLSQLEKRMQAERTGHKAFCVHRLDRGVSGVLVFGKSLEIAQALRDQFEARKPKRRYLALVAGTMRDTKGTFRSHLVTDKNLNRHSTDDTAQGELAITHYQVLRTFGGVSLVEISLETGRRNQIRVHFSEAGHPVLGDGRYGAAIPREIVWPYRRLALHAQTLGFSHPAGGKPLEFESPLPTEMQAFERMHVKSSRRN